MHRPAGMQTPESQGKCFPFSCSRDKFLGTLSNGRRCLSLFQFSKIIIYCCLSLPQNTDIDKVDFRIRVSSRSEKE